MDAVTALRRTENLLKTRGRCRYVTRTNDGKLCLQGAVFEAIPDDMALRINVMTALRATLGHDSVAEFNDLESTTDKDVYDLINKAIQRLEGER